MVPITKMLVWAVWSWWPFPTLPKRALVLPQGACGLVGGAVLFHTLVFSQPMNVAAMEAQSTAIFLGPDG